LSVFICRLKRSVQETSPVTSQSSWLLRGRNYVTTNVILTEEGFANKHPA